MTTLNWTGDAPVVSQTETFTFTLTAIADVVTTTVAQFSVSFTTTTTVNADAAQGMLDVILASGITQLTELTWSILGDVLTAIGTEGRPFVVTMANAGTGVVTALETIAPSGPNHWIAENFDTGSLPVNADIVYVNTDVPILYNLDQSLVKLTDFIIGDDYFNSNIGLTQISPNGYFEYLPRYLKIGSERSIIGLSSGVSKNGNYFIDTGTNTDLITAQGGTLELLTNSSATIVNAIGQGVVNIAADPTESSLLNIIHASGNSTVTIGLNVTITTIESQNSARLTSDSNPVNIRKEGSGTLTLRGDEIITSAIVVLGTLDLQNGSTVTALQINQDGICSLTNAVSEIDIVAITMNRGATFRDPYGRRANASTGYTLAACGIDDVIIETPDGLALTVAYS